jgi:predicted RNA-binding protein YlqC (UPF0109 family)
MKDLIRVIVEHLVTNPGAIEVRETKGRSTTVYELRMAPEDAGRVIGKNGRTIDGIRTVLNAAASRTKQRVVFQVVDEETAQRPRKKRTSRVGTAASYLAVVPFP